MYQDHSPIGRFLQRDDSELVRRVLEGAREEYVLLVRRHFFAVYARAYARLGARPEAAAVTLEAFVEAYRRLDTLAPDESFQHRVWAIARERAKHPPRGLPHDGDDLERHRRIRQAILALDETARLAVLLRYGARLSNRAIARTCGISVRESGSLLHNAEAPLAGETVSDIAAAITPALAADEVARAALREQAVWRTPDAAPRTFPRRRHFAGAAAVLVGIAMILSVELRRPSIATPAPAPAPAQAAIPVAVPVESAPAAAPVPAPNGKTGTLEGRVLDARTELPLTDFEVAHPDDRDAQGKPVFVKTADPDGRFYLGGLDPGPVEILIRAPGYANSVCRATVSSTINEPTEIVARLERARAIEGLVVDASGAPVPDVAIFVNEIPFPFLEGREAGRSDAQGRFRAEGVPPRAVPICAWHPAYAAAAAPAPEGAETLRLTLAPACRVEGVLRAEGQPLVNAEIRAVPEDPASLPVVAYTGDDGHYLLEGLPAGPADLAVNWSDTRRVKRPVTLEVGGTARMDIDFPATATRLEGKVTQNGTPVQYAEIEAHIASASGEQFITIAKTSKEGWYRTGPVPPGSAQLFVMAVTADSRMRRKMVEATVPEAESVTQDIDFRERATLCGTLAGLEPDQHARVYVLWSALERQPMNRAQLEDLTKYAVARQFLRQNGALRIDSLEPGRYMVFAVALNDESPEDFAQARTAIAEVSIDGKNSGGVDLMLKQHPEE